jgi:hypothetical protein
MTITTLEDAYCLAFGPPILPGFGRIITEYLVPWAPEALGWFSHVGENIYTANVSINTNDTEYDLDTAFYMDHSISGHYGHFIGDCLPRLHAWEICRALFGEMKVIVADGAQTDFQTHLLNAAGVASRDIIRIKGLVRCRRLLLATQSLGVEHYASPTSAVCGPPSGIAAPFVMLRCRTKYIFRPPGLNSGTSQTRTTWNASSNDTVLPSSVPKRSAWKGKSRLWPMRCW